MTFKIDIRYYLLFPVRLRVLSFADRKKTTLKDELLFFILSLIRMVIFLFDWLLFLMRYVIEGDIY